ncbi:protein SEY1 [Protomyces lactucae-debilis]|uniref:Protein SEY1 n=1 Tax=Protomyces lactucae-debilis TaxID=2754530 RepID=A0A1Y2FLJ3_PROLT|nr:protein SEY1 [Protomyces lactucae-debilis]ORY84224.1 protein SEY1 [Protomyces lactucae-debilis]
MTAQDPYQLISSDQQFAGELSSYLTKVGLADAGFNYNVVAVFGSQSTGKSTVLNASFGTRFATMDTVSRQQTTKGIWLAKAADANILVMDVEGTDGRERGDDQDFERKSALFSMATSEVLVINMWETQVGLYNGANMGLLKTVFEVNLQTFQKNQKQRGRSLLLFVLRDHLGTTPLDSLANTIKADLSKMWDALAKPEGTEQTVISDYFDLQFVGLPHKVLMADEFAKQVALLRDRFSDASSNGLFKPEYHKRIPADGFSHYAKGIWDTILSNKDLDLPTQQELLAQFRCDEIASAAATQFNTRISATEQNMRPKEVYGPLAAEMTVALTEALAAFDAEASRYSPKVYEKKRADLLATLEARLLVLFKAQLTAWRFKCVEAFSKEAGEQIQRKDAQFKDVVSQQQDKQIALLTAEAKACTVEPLTWRSDAEIEGLRRDLADATDVLRSNQMQRIQERERKSFKAFVDDKVGVCFNRPTPQLWDHILEPFDAQLHESTSSLMTKYKLLDVPAEQLNASLAQWQVQAWQILRQRVLEEVSESLVLLKLREAFEDQFKFDKDGMPIVWKAGDDLEGQYRSAREAALKLLPVYSKIQKSDGKAVEIPAAAEDDEAPSTRLLTSSQQADIATRFKRTADALYLDAKRSTVSSVASIPVYFYVLLLLLGWNELMALLRSPLYFMTIAFGGLVAYAVYTLNLSGPLEQVARATFGGLDKYEVEGRDVVKLDRWGIKIVKRLRDYAHKMLSQYNRKSGPV